RQLRLQVALFRAETKPFGGFGRISGDALPLGVENAEVVLGGLVRLLSRLAKPGGRLSEVFGYASALRVKNREIELRCAVTLLGCFAKPFHRFAEILRHVLATRVKHAQFELRGRISLGGLGLEFGRSRAQRRSDCWGRGWSSGSRAGRSGLGWT